MNVLLLYTHKITPRFSYIAKHLFTRILGIEVRFSTRVEDFIGHKGPKLTYTKQPLQNEFFIRNHDLLFRQGIEKVAIQVSDWDGLPAFFKTGDRSNIPYDILAASFYLISRYEEYLPHIRDSHGRFPPSESLAHQNNFLHLPLVELWAFRLFAILKERFPDLTANPSGYSFQPVIDVTTSHAFSHRGFFRGLGGLVYDISRLQFARVWQRVKVGLNLAADPYNNFDKLIELHRKYKVEAKFFFQFATYSTYDKNVSPNNQKFQALIKSVGDYAPIALALSYAAYDKPELMKEEKDNLTEVLHRNITASRMRFNRVDIPQTYRDLVASEIAEDYTLGYSHQIGFRASTCTPFYFYDMALESIQPVKIIPFAFHDYALLSYASIKDIFNALDGLYASLQKVQGNLCFVFSNELLGGHQTEGWLSLYEEILKKYHV